MAGLYNQDDWMRNLIQISIVIFIMLQKKIIIFCVVKWINKHKNNKNTWYIWNCNILIEAYMKVHKKIYITQNSII